MPPPGPGSSGSAQDGTAAGLRQAGRLYFAQGSAQNGGLDRTLAGLVKINDPPARSDQQRIAGNESSSTTATILTLLAALALGAAIGYLVSRAIKRTVDLVRERLASLRDTAPPVCAPASRCWPRAI